MYMHNVRVPGMLLHEAGRAAARSVGMGNRRSNRLDRCDLDQKHFGRPDLAGAPSLGVVAPKEYDDVQAAAQLKVTWKGGQLAAGRREPVRTHACAVATNVVLTAETGDLAAGFAKAAKTLAATYKVPYQSHNALAPNCAIADASPRTAQSSSARPRASTARARRSRMSPGAAGEQHQGRLLRGRQVAMGRTCTRSQRRRRR